MELKSDKNLRPISEISLKNFVLSFGLVQKWHSSVVLGLWNRTLYAAKLKSLWFVRSGGLKKITLFLEQFCIVFFDPFFWRNDTSRRNVFGRITPTTNSENKRAHRKYSPASLALNNFENGTLNRRIKLKLWRGSQKLGGGCHRCPHGCQEGKLDQLTGPPTFWTYQGVSRKKRKIQNFGRSEKPRKNH